MKKNLALKDVIPTKPIFRLAKKPGKEFAIRAPNMADTVFFAEHYESLQKMQAVIQERNWSEICRIVYYLMDNDTRAEFPAIDEEIVNIDGFKERKVTLGWQVLLAHLTGIEEAVNMLAALSRAIMNSSPIIEKVVEDEVKKKMKQSMSTGRKS